MPSTPRRRLWESASLHPIVINFRVTRRDLGSLRRRGRSARVAVLAAFAFAASTAAAHPDHSPLDALASARLRAFLRTDRGRACLERAGVQLIQTARTDSAWDRVASETATQQRLLEIVADHQATAVAAHVLETWGEGNAGTPEHLARCPVCRSLVPGLEPAASRPGKVTASFHPNERPRTDMPLSRWLTDLDGDGAPETRATDLDGDQRADLLETDSDGDNLFDAVRRWDRRGEMWVLHGSSSSFAQWKRTFSDAPSPDPRDETP
jgi:hypothetical protein